MAKKPRNFAVIGLGSFGGTVAKELSRFGNFVIGIDINERNVTPLADTVSHAVIADARDETALREAGVGDCDVAVIAIGEDLEANVLATINTKMLGVPVVWAKSISRTHHRILMKLGADRVVEPEEEVGMRVAQMLHNPMMRDYVSIGNGYHVVTMVVPDGLDGKTLGSLDLAGRFNLRCVGVMRGTEYIGQDGTDCALAKDDRLLLLGKRQDLRDFAASI